MDNSDLTQVMQELMIKMARMEMELKDLKQRATALPKSEPEQLTKSVRSTTRRKALRRLAGGLLAGVAVMGVATTLPEQAEAKIIANPTSQNNRIGAIITAQGDSASGSLYNPNPFPVPGDNPPFKYGLVVLSATGPYNLSSSSNVRNDDTAIFAVGAGTGIYARGNSGVIGVGNLGVSGFGSVNQNSIGVYGQGPLYAVQGFNGVGGAGTSGVRGEGNNIGVWGYCNGGGAGLYGSQNNGFAAAVLDGDLLIHPSIPFSGSGITPSAGNLYVKGSIHYNGTLFNSGGDLAEFIPVLDRLEPGDVVEIDPIEVGQFRRCTTSGSLAVAGVISTRPGVSLGASDHKAEGQSSDPQLALAGRIPVKVTDEGGAIRPGDLLIASATPGHARRASKRPRTGSVLGKALGRLEKGTGQVEMLVMLR